MRGTILTKHGAATAEAYAPLRFAPGGDQCDRAWPAMRAIVGGSSRFEALHLALSSSCQLTLIFGSIATPSDVVYAKRSGEIRYPVASATPVTACQMRDKRMVNSVNSPSRLSTSIEPPCC